MADSGASIEPQPSTSNSVSIRSDKVRIALIKFVKCFVLFFEDYLSGYIDRFINDKPKTGKWFDCIGGADVGKIITQAIPPSVGRTIANGGFVLAKGIPSTAANLYNQAQTRKLFGLINKFESEPKELRKTLVDAGIDVFQKFEYQFMKVASSKYPEIASKILAQDAANRALNYFKTKPSQDYSKIESFTRGVVLGKSKNDYLKRYKKYQIKLKDCNWYTNSLFEKVGLEVENVYYVDMKSKSEKYDYRILFGWEEISKINIADEHLMFKNDERCYIRFRIKPVRENGYLLKDANLEELIKEILNELNSTHEETLKQILKQEVDNEIRLSNKIDDNSAISNKNHNELLRKIQGGLLNQKNESIVFNVRYPIDLFTGREQEIKDLHTKLQSSSCATTISHMVVISGLGGIGKTELARKYISEYGKCYDNVVWMNAESETTLQMCFFDLIEERPAMKLNIIGEENNLNNKKIVDAVYLHFSGTSTLFVFDNADKNEEFYHFLPQTRTSCDAKKPYVLITSRNQEWNLENIETIILRDMAMNDAIDLVKKSLKIVDESEDDDVKNLVEVLQCFPLAMQQAIAYIKFESKLSDFAVKDYLEDYKKDTRGLLDNSLFKGIDINYATTIFKTWKLTIDKIIHHEQHGNLAQQILFIIAYLAPDNIERTIFSNLTNGDEKKLNSAVWLLVKYSIVEKQEKQNVLNIHRLVQTVTRLNLKEHGEDKEVLKMTMELINSVNAEDKYMHHFISTWRHASEHKNIVLNNFFTSSYGKKKDSPLHLLALDGDIDGTKVLLKHLEEDQPDKILSTINSRNLFGETALHVASEMGHFSTIKYLVENRAADFTLRDRSKECPLLWAAFGGQLDIVKYLIEIKKVDYNMINSFGNNVIHRAAQSGNLDLLKYLVEIKHVDYNVRNKANNLPFHSVAYRGHLNIIKYFIENLNIDCNTKGKLGNNILHIVAESGYLNLVKYLVEDKKVDCYVKNTAGQIPLLSAAFNGRLNVIKYFLDDQNVDHNITDNNGNTVLHLAAQGGSLDVIKYLVQNKNVDLTTMNMSGENTLLIASHNGHLNIVKYLIDDQNLDYKLVNSSENTIMHLSVQSGNLNLVKYLVKDKSVNCTTKNDAGDVPLISVAYKGHLDIIKYFIEDRNIDCNVTDTCGNNILHIAAQSGHLDLTKYLVEKMFFDLGRENANGERPLNCAVLGNHSDTIKYLASRDEHERKT